MNISTIINKTKLGTYNFGDTVDIFLEKNNSNEAIKYLVLFENNFNNYELEKRMHDKLDDFCFCKNIPYIKKIEYYANDIKIDSIMGYQLDMYNDVIDYENMYNTGMYQISFSNSIIELESHIFENEILSLKIIFNDIEKCCVYTGKDALDKIKMKPKNFSFNVHFVSAKYSINDFNIINNQNKKEIHNYCYCKIISEKIQIYKKITQREKLQLIIIKKKTRKYKIRLNKSIKKLNNKTLTNTIKRKLENHFLKYILIEKYESISFCYDIYINELTNEINHIENYYNEQILNLYDKINKSNIHPFKEHIFTNDTRKILCDNIKNEIKDLSITILEPDYKLVGLRKILFESLCNETIHKLKYSNNNKHNYVIM